MIFNILGLPFFCGDASGTVVVEDGLGLVEGMTWGSSVLVVGFDVDVDIDVDVVVVVVVVVDIALLDVVLSPLSSS